MNGTTACSWDSIIDLDKLWLQYERIIKDNGAIVLTASQPFTTALIESNKQLFRYEWIWIKRKPSNFLSGNKMPLKYTEEALVFYKQLPLYNPQMQKRDDKNKRKNKLTSSLLKDETKGIDKITDKYQERLKSGTNDKIYPRNYQTFSNRTKGLHPTQKPVSLFEYLIKTYTNEGDLVLDNVAGSGTTGVACQNTNRDYILIEKEQKYIDVIKERLES